MKTMSRDQLAFLTRWCPNKHDTRLESPNLAVKAKPSTAFSPALFIGAAKFSSRFFRRGLKDEETTHQEVKEQAQCHLLISKGGRHRTQSRTKPETCPRSWFTAGEEL
jgi:hypothetical protein